MEYSLITLISLITGAAIVFILQRQYIRRLETDNDELRRGIFYKANIPASITAPKEKDAPKPEKPKFDAGVPDYFQLKNEHNQKIIDERNSQFQPHG